MGAPRDLPHDAVIHPSVREMIKAGILDKDSIPPKGGDNPNLPDITNIAYTWKNLRNSLSDRASNMSGGSESKDPDGAPHRGMEVPAKTTS